MTIRWWTSRDSAAFKCLVGLAILYGVMSYVAYNVVYVRHVRPLGVDAPPDRFSEARAIEHVRYLTVDIDGRQVRAPGTLFPPFMDICRCGGRCDDFVLLFRQWPGRETGAG